MGLKPVKIIIAGIDQFSAKFDKQFKHIEKVGTKINSIGKKMTLGLTVPVLGAGTAIIKTASDFEKSLNKVEALTQATSFEMKTLSDQAKTLGLETKFSAKEAADGMAFLGMAGFQVNEIISAMPGLLDLAASSQIELSRAADITSNIMGAFALDASEATRVADILAATTSSANVDMEMLAETMKFAGPIAKKFGASLEDTSAAAGFLGNIGIQGSLAGTALRTMFINLASPAKAGAEALNEIGISVDNGFGKIRDFKDIMSDLSKILPTLGEAKQIQILNDIFGKRAISATAGIVDNIASGKRGFLQLADSLQNVIGRAAEMARIMMKGASGAMARFMAALEGVGIAFGESGLLDSFTSILNKLSKMLQSFAKLSPTILKIITVVALLVAALGPLLAMFGALASGIGSLMIGLSAIGGIASLAASPFLILGAKISLVVAAVTALITIGKNLDTTWGKIAGSFMTYLNPFFIAPMYIISRWDKIVPYFKLVWNKISDIFGGISAGPIGTAIGWLIDSFGWLIDKALELADTVVFGALGTLATTFFDTNELKAAGLDSFGQPITGDEGFTESNKSGVVSPTKNGETVTKVVFDNLPESARIIPEKGNQDIKVQNQGSLSPGFLY